MEITYGIVITLLTLISGDILKIFNFNVKYQPIVNLGIGIIGAVICIVAGLENNILQSFTLCITASMGAGGIYDLTKTKMDFKKPE